MHQRDENLMALAEEKELAESLYVQERIYRVHYANTLQLKGVSLVDKKHMVEIYFRYQHFYYPILEQTHFYESVEDINFELAAYKEDRYEIIRLQSDMAKYQHKATLYFDNKIPKYDDDYLLPLTHLCDMLLVSFYHFPYLICAHNIYLFKGKRSMNLHTLDEILTPMAKNMSSQEIFQTFGLFSLVGLL